MKFSEIYERLSCKEFHRGDNWDNAEILNVTAGDLMSEVLVDELENLILITALNSEQALRTASMVDAVAVVLVNSKEPNRGMISLAEELGITLLSVPYSMFDTCGRLCRLLGRGD